jgi:hypothetical protein
MYIDVQSIQSVDISVLHAGSALRLNGARSLNYTSLLYYCGGYCAVQQGTCASMQVYSSAQQ